MNDTNPQDDQTHDEPTVVQNDELQEDTQSDNEADVLREELVQMTSIAKRTMADFQNFKRRTEEEREEYMVYANKQLLNAIFPAIDNLGRAIDSMPEEIKGTDWTSGLMSTQKSLLDGLASVGLESIDETGVPVDPNRHEVLMEGDGPAGEVLEVFEKGYSFKGKTVRPAKVQVGRS